MYRGLSALALAILLVALLITPKPTLSDDAIGICGVILTVGLAIVMAQFDNK